MVNEDDLPIAGHFPNNEYQQREPKPSAAPLVLLCQKRMRGTGELCGRAVPHGLTWCAYHEMNKTT